MAETKSQAEETPLTCVLFTVGSLIGAIEATWVARVAMLDQVSEPRVVAGKMPLVEIDNQWAVAWDIGRILEAPSPAGGWLLLNMPSAGGALVPMALRTGRCLAVAQVRKVTRLPGQVFRGGVRSLSGIFPVSTLSRHQGSGVGILIDPRELWGAREMGAARAALSAPPDAKRSGLSSAAEVERHD